jgi:hypothetical protein
LTLVNRFLGSSLAAVLVAGTVACGSGSSSPAGPSAAATGGGAAVAGATIRGVVETGTIAGATATSDVHALAAASGVRVSVVGSILATTTDGSGQFEIRGVPSGRVQLRFESSGIDARLEIEGLAEGQSLNVNVHVSSAGAFLAETEDHRNETTLRGKLDSVSGSRLTLLGRTVQTDGLTAFVGRSNERISLADLKAGQVVEIEGTNQADGTLYARKVKLEDGAGNEAPESELNFVGAIQGLSPLVVAGRSVATDGSTQVLDRKNTPITLGSLKVGDKVEVEGTSRADGSVLAKKIKLED